MRKVRYEDAWDCDECGESIVNAGCHGYALKCLDGSVVKLCCHCFEQMDKEEMLDMLGVHWYGGYDESYADVETVANEWETEKKRKERVFATPEVLRNVV